VQCEQRRTVARLGLLGDGDGNTENALSDRSPGMVPCTATDADDAAQVWRSEQGEALIGERLDRGDAFEKPLEEAAVFGRGVIRASSIGSAIGKRSPGLGSG